MEKAESDEIRKEMLEKAQKNVKNYCLGTIITADVFASDRNKIDNIVKKHYHECDMATSVSLCARTTSRS